jgi:2-alkenal reductase
MNSKTRKYFPWLITLGIILPLLSFACSALTPGAAPNAPQVEQPEPAVTVVVQAEPTRASAPVQVFGEEPALIDLYNLVSPAVVNITVYAQQGNFVLPVSQGSGFVLDESGNIVTNAHVVHGADQLEVTFADASVYEAEILGEDFNSDIAVIKIPEVPAGVVPLTLGGMDNLHVGQTVVAIGNPFGLSGTLTRGIISALGRSIPALTAFTIPMAIQTDAAINPGNSGGPLLNLQGEVIGINAQIETGSNGGNSNLGIGFAIPINIVKLVVPDLIANGEHQWAWVGVRGGSLFPALVDAMDLPFDKGAYISDVPSNGPADRAGLRGADETRVIDGRQLDVGGDVIVAVDGQEVNTFDDLLIYISLSTSPGDEITVTVYRDGEYRDFTIELEERPDQVGFQASS